MARLAACAPGCWLLAAVAYTAGAVAQRGDLFLGLLGTTSHVALGVTGGLLLLAATAPGRAPRRSWRLDSRAVAWLGTISYGVYLWHVPLLDVVHTPGGAFPPPVSVGAGLGVVAAVAAGSVALGAVSWYAIERPAQRLGARLTRPGPVALVSPDPVLPRLRPEPSFAGGSRNS
jgi:peptidoglycan/LPS O-acetylase OafA/YrhL